MAEISKVGVGGLATYQPSNNHRQLFGDDAAKGRNNGSGERIGLNDLCYVRSDGYVMRALEDQTGTTAAVNDVQTLTMQANNYAGSISSGTVVFGVGGQWTAPLDVINNTTSDMQTAIRALSTVGAGNLTLGGTFPNLTFTGAGTNAGKNLPLIEVDANVIMDNNPNIPVGFTVVHTTVGQPIGASGAEQAQSRVRGACVNLVSGKGQPISLYDACVLSFPPGTFTPGKDYYLSGTVPGGLTDTAVLTGSKPVGYALDSSRFYLFAVR